MEGAVPIRVLIADASAATRAGLRAALRAAGCEIVAEVAEAEEAVSAGTERDADVALVDAQLPGGGIAVVSRIVAERGRTSVIVLTGEPNDRELLRAVRAGAVGYLSKDIELDRLPVVVTSVARGETALPRALLARVLSEMRSPEAAGPLRLPSGRLVELTARERTVAAALRSGADTRQIAAQLDLSEVTVRRHISTLLSKLEAPDRRSAIALLGATEASA